MTEWRDDIKKVLLKAGLQNMPITFLFADTQVGATTSVLGWCQGTPTHGWVPSCPLAGTDLTKGQVELLVGAGLGADSQGKPLKAGG